MSVNLPQETNNMFSFLQHSLEKSKEHDNVLQVLIDEFREMHTEVKETASEVKILAKEIRDENRLLPAEIDDLYNAVVHKSILLAKVNNSEDDDNFTKIVGKYRRLIWSKLKKKFGVSKYIHVKRIDFKPTMEFIQTFNPEDYL
ncbi:ORF6C domain-containing protein [Paenibacillus sp. FSL L8-0708]|uniref:ORF6C domain-containing protein n=1 Tax=Paenibacillus sp. FSL L8-0708 TaxID=2975311 RepID=UPI0030F8C9D7